MIRRKEGFAGVLEEYAKIQTGGTIMPIRMSGMISGLDTDAIIKELMSAQSQKKVALEQNKEKLSWKKEKWEELNTKTYALYTEKLSALKLEGTYLTKKAASSNTEKAEVTATNAANGSYELKINKLASAQIVTGADISSKNLTKSSKLTTAGMEAGQKITVTVNKAGSAEPVEKTLDVTEETTVDDFTAFLKDAGINANFDAGTGRFYLSAKNSGAENSFTLVSDKTGDTGLAALGLGNIDSTLATSGQTAANSSTMAIVAAQDAEYVLNGATLTSSGNSVTVNGLSIELKGTTSGEERINITVANDTDAVYKKIKEFVTSYNELMTDMYGKYTAASARKYAMLTDEEKEAMTDKQVELWEDKIKGALLRNDSTLNSLMTIFRGGMQGTAEVDGKTYSLSSFGIVTGAYTEHGLIHINGDPDDATYANNEDSLKKALESDPSGTGKALSKIFSQFYDSLTKQMAASSISSALTLYNDKQIQSQMDTYEKQISSWEDKLSALEDRYYKQFSSMESSLADLQNKQNQLSGLLGMS